jgi:hypothetical protein
MHSVRSLVFAGFFALLALSSYYFGHSGRWPYWLGLSIVFAIVAYAAPQILAPLNRWWTKLGLLLHAIVSPRHSRLHLLLLHRSDRIPDAAVRK